MNEDLVTFLKARLDEEDKLARRCNGDECGEWSAHGHTVDFWQVDLSGFHPTIALHVALHDPARILRRSRPSDASWPVASSVRQRATRSCRGTTAATASSTAPPGHATTCSTSPRPTAIALTSPDKPEAAQPHTRAHDGCAHPAGHADYLLKIFYGTLGPYLAGR
ncbi:DUF6221 family protein [Streptomyces sp. NPDC005181]|uniref:DUF6221 family protein n=1 Tax=Streptomyces sp. NPDC005181 TaxID=3156869 RepID=UPI0033B1F31F